MKLKLFLPIIMLLGIVGCGNTNNNSTTSNSGGLDIITDVPENDKVTPTQGASFSFDDYNDSNV